MQKSGESAFFGWKGKTLHQITSSLKKNKNNITDTHNIFLSNPLSHYRKEIASIDLSYGNPRLNVHFDELNGAGQTIVKTDTPTSCNGIDNTLDINLSTNKYDTGGAIQFTSTLCFSQEDTARRRVRSGGMPKKDIAIVDNSQASRKSQYYTSSSQYLYDRNKAFSQNERPYDKSSFTPSDIACESPTVKPNNSRFFEQGAVKSGELIMRKKYDTITENLAKYQSAYGCSVANALAYASKDAGYMPKEHRGYPLTESPRFCFFEPENTYDFASPEITSIEMGTGAAIVYFSHSASSAYSLLYMVVSEPDGIVEYGTSSPIFITGLSNQTTYTFTVAVLAIIYTSDVESGSTTNELLYTLTSQNNYTVGKNGNAQNSTAIIYIPSMYNNYIVNEIVDHGFENCLALRLVEIPSSIIKIGDYAFSGCKLLQTITIPAYTTSIGYYAFLGCSTLSSIVVDTGNTRFSTDGKSLLSLSGDTLLQYCTVGQTTYTVPNTVKLIDIRAFSGSQVQNVSIPDGLLEINEYAFSDCSGIETIHIPSSVSVLETGVFSGCHGLVSITIDSNTIQTFSDNLFYQCYQLESINIPTSLRTIGTYTFFECTSLERIIIPNIEDIGDYAFSGCSSLNTIIFNGDRPSIANRSFENIASDASIYYYPTSMDWPGSAISGIAPTSLVSISGSIIVGETLTATHKLVEAGFIDESVTVSYTWYVGNSTLYSETTNTLVLLSSYESSQIRVSISYRVNGQYTSILSAYTDRILLIPGSTTITNIENGDGSILVYFETATNASSYVVYGYNMPFPMFIVSQNGNSSPIVVSGLTVDNAYTFTVTSIRTTQYATIYSTESAMSDSITVYSSNGYTNNGSFVNFTGSQSHLYIPNTNSTIPILPQSYYVPNITHIIIENGVDTINSNAFNSNAANSYAFTNLQDIVLPNTLTEIGDYAFNNCSNLLSINIPSSVLSIGNNICRYCSKLTTITVDSENNDYTANNNILFNITQTELIIYAAGNNSPIYYVPSNITTFGPYAFAGATGLREIIIPNNVETLGPYAFAGAIGLSEIIIPNNVETLGEGCFSNCSNIGMILMNNGITSIPTICFESCTSLQSITLPDTITSIGNRGFESCTSLQSFTLPDTITSIGYSGFERCTSLQSITLPSNLTQISSSTFSTCTSLTSIVIPSLVTYIDYGAFYNCSNLASMTFNGNKPTIQTNSFYGLPVTAVFYYYSNTDGWDGMTSLQGYPLFDLYVDEYSSDDLIYDSNDSTAVIGFNGTQAKLLIPDNVTSISIYNANNTLTRVIIGSGVTNIYDFSNFSRLEEIIINGNALTTIHIVAFNNCTSLTSINLPSSLTRIDNAAFSNCSSLTSINLPSSLSTIGTNIFEGCTDLTTVTVDAENTNFKTIGNALCSYDGSILYSYYDYVSTSYTVPDSVTTVNDLAFTFNTIIQSITMNNVVILNNGAFQNCSNLSSITLPNTLTSIGNRALQNLAITSIVLPASVTSIGEYAISSCSNLTSITFEGNKPTIESTAFVDNASSAIIYYYNNTDGWAGMTSLQNYPLVDLYVPEYSSDGLRYTNDDQTVVSVFDGTQSKLLIPDTVTTINDNAISNKPNITHIKIGSGVSTIGNNAFVRCLSLVEVIITGNSLTSIGYNIFQGCTSLTTVTIDETNTNYKTIGNALFSYDETKLYSYYDNISPSYNVPNSVTELKNLAFADNTVLQNIVIPNSVTSLGDFLFSGCINLSSVTIGNGITIISSRCFNACANLNTINLPNSITTIYSFAFAFCGISTITIPNSVTSINDAIFSNCSNITSIIFDGNKPSLYDNTFNEVVTAISIYYYYNTYGWNGITTINGSVYSYPLIGMMPLDYSSDDLIRDNYDSTIVIGFNGNQSKVFIPDNVVSISENAFYENTVITHIATGSGLTNIGSNAFAYSSLIEFTSNTVETFGNFVFSHCYNLTTVNLPSTTNTMGYNIFRLCTNLRYLKIDSNNSSYVANYEKVFIYYYNDDDTISYGLYCYYNYTQTSYTDDNDIIDIKEYAFANCSNLLSITLSNNIINMRTSCFENCTSLSSIVLPEYITQIADTLFSTCSSLTSIIIPSSISDIYANVFYNCTNLTSIIFNGNKPNYQHDSFSGLSSNAVFYYYSNTDGWDGMTSLQGYQLVVLNVDEYISTGLIYDDDRTTVIGFKGIQPKLLIPDEVTSIAIINTNTTVTHIMIGTGVTSIYYIGSLTLLQDIVINGNTLTTIGGSTFSNLSSLTSINLPSSLITIGSAAFNNCTSLSSINLPSSLITIGSAAFNNCTSLSSINLPSSLSSIGTNIFEVCTSLTTVTVDESNTNFKTIGNALCSYDGSVLYSYYDYVSTSYIVPDSVTTINDLAFRFNTTIQSITMNNVVIFNNGAFQNCTSLSSITLSNTLTTIASQALQNLAITSIVMPASVTTIGGYAIAFCSNLTTITFEGNKPTIDSTAFYQDASGGVIYYYSGSSGWDGMTSLQGYELVELYSDYSSDGLVYNNNDTYMVSDFSGTQAKIIIPNSVTSLGSFAFANNDTITEIIMFDNVNTISNQCFSECKNLVNVKLSNTISYILSDLFFNTSIQHIIIPASVYYIANYAFTNCKKIKTMLFEGNKPTLQSYYAFLYTNPDMVVYYYADKTGWDNTTTFLDYFTAIALYDVGYSSEGLLYDEYDSSIVTGFTGSQTKVLIPDNITKINDWVFQSAKITHVKIGNQVTSIGNGAFDLTLLLQEVIIDGESLTTIGDYAFWDSALTTINIPSSVSSIGYAIFNGCNNIIRLTIDDANTHFKTDDKTILSYDGSIIYTYYDNLLSYTIPNSVTTIFQEAFAITLLKSIDLNNVSVIGDYAFYLCTSLTSIITGSALSTIGIEAFYNCISLTTINLPSSLTTIGKAAFYNCTSLTSINLPSSLSSIGTNIFLRCTGLTTVTVDAENTNFKTIGNALFSYDGTIIYSYYDYVSISYTLPDSVTEIVQEVFTFNTIIQSITMNNVVTIGNAAFQDCTNLSSITLSNTLTTIGSRAIQNLAITSIVIPSSVTSIGEYAISSCSNLTSITFEGNKPTIESTAFVDNASSAIIYYYSGSSGWDGTTSINDYNVIPISKYTMVITSGGQPPDGNIIFDGYIIVNANTNLIIGIYETGDSTNHLLPTSDTALDSADNIYPISNAGVNFYSNTLQNGLNTSFNNFNLYQENSVYVLYNIVYDFYSVHTVIIT
jgi:hypothetical protein